MKRPLAALAVSFTLAVGLGACPANSPEPTKTVATDTAPAGSPPSSDTSAAKDPHAGTEAPFAGGAQAPFAGGADQAEKDPEVEKLVAAAEKQEEEFISKPSDALKVKVGEAYYQAGHTMMMSPKLGSKVKYRGALKLYREALKYDPKHAKAADEKKTIEDIYQSMGMPIPG